jgi:hypothetical protein
MQDKYGNLYANDTICKRFLKLGFPFHKLTREECHNDSEPIFAEFRDTPEKICIFYHRPLLTTINDWLAFGNLEERTKRDKQLEEKLISLVDNNLL